MSREYWRQLSIYYLLTVGAIVVYWLVSRLWVPFGGLSLTLFRFELPLLGYLLTLLYFGKLKNTPLKFILVVLPFVVVFAGIDLFYRFLGRSPRPSDLNNVWSIFEFSPVMGYVCLLIASLIPLSVVGLLLMAARVYSPKALLQSLALKLSLLALLVSILISNPFFELQQQFFKFIRSSQKMTMHYNGRFSSFIYYYGKERDNTSALIARKNAPIDIKNTLYQGVAQRSPNLHFIVLESWIDPTLLKGIEFDRPPMGQSLLEVMAGGEFSMPISPVYGGSTAQAEFELLTGIKAYGLIESIEFNVMEGQLIEGFVSRLQDHGYQVNGMIATSSGYYNSQAAYQSLGLGAVEFLADGGLRQAGDVEIFDGDLLEYNLKWVKQQLAQSSAKPLFNYVLGLYGHHPYYRNDKLRPSLIRVEHGNKRVERIANQFYYRTEALGQYIKDLKRIDPASMVLIISDHLPPIINNKINYPYDKHNNIALMYDGQQQLDISGLYFYQIPWLVWQRLSTTDKSQDISPVLMEQLYFQALNQSIGH